MSGIINKVKEVLHKDHTPGATTSSTGTTTGVTGTHATTGTSNTTGTAEGVAGPHSSRLANAADPRVDSDLDGSRNAGASYGSTGATGVTGASNSAGYGTTGQTVHNSALLNKVDPRVDSTGSSTAGGSTVGSTAQNTGGTTRLTGTSGGLSSSTNAGPHDSNIANKMDPRVDSDLDGRGNRSGAHTGGIMGASGSHATPGSGTAQNTAGPHNSDIVNKLDPRVDSDMDGSGGRMTRAGHGRNVSSSSKEGKDPTDAAQVPPSVLRETIGHPIVTHDGPSDHQQRHSKFSMSEQDKRV